MALDPGGDGHLGSGAWTSADDQGQVINRVRFMQRYEACAEVEEVRIVVGANQHADDAQEVEVVDVVEVVPDVGNNALSLIDKLRPEFKVQDVEIIEI